MEPHPDTWLRFAHEAERMEAPLYAALARHIHDDSDLRALTAGARPHQPHPNLLFGAVHFLLLRGADGELRRYYRTLGGDAPVDADTHRSFRLFCLAHRPELESLIASRVTNTNEVGRAAFLQAGFLELARQATEPLHLIELGPSAGLNMFWDHYGYRFIRGGETFHSGAPHAALVLDTELRGLGLPPFGPPPRVGMRIGLERDPVDLGQAENRDWLRALVWLDHPARLQRLEQALAARAEFTPDIRGGDALAALPDAMAAAPADGTLCIYHTIVTYQFAPDERQALDDLLTLAGLRRPVWRLSLEGTSDLTYPLKLDRYSGGAMTSRVLALCGSQGGWMEWRG